MFKALPGKILPFVLTAAIVVLISLPSAASAKPPQPATGGTGSTGLAALRNGSTPPSASRRARR